MRSSVCGLILSILSLFLVHCSSTILIDVADSTTPLEHPCGPLDLGEKKLINCIKIQDDVWAIGVSSPKNTSRWQVEGGSNGSVIIGHPVRYLHCLSSMGNASKVTLVQADGEQMAFVINGRDWEVTYKDGSKICIPGAIPNSYCRYEHVENFSNPVSKCSDNSQSDLSPAECLRFSPSLIKTAAKESTTCRLN